jgi:uncharacterized phage-associated protein
MTKYTPIELANTFLEKYSGGIGIEHMKLQKLCYYAHGWWLAYKDEPFLSEEPQVWQYGPVFNSLYHLLSHFGRKSILEPQKANPLLQKLETIKDEEINQLIDWVWNRYSNYSAETLSEMTHAKGTPWRILAEKHSFRVPRNLDIPDNLIKEFFKKEAAKLQP